MGTDTHTGTEVRATTMGAVPTTSLVVTSITTIA